LGLGGGGTIKDEGTYGTIGDKLTLTSGPDYDACAGEVGTFTVTATDEDSIGIELSSDGCDSRAISLDGKILRRQESLSVAPQTTTTTTTIPLSELPELEASAGVTSGVGALVRAGTYQSTSLAVPLRVSFEQDVSVVTGGGFTAIGLPGFDFDTAPSLTFAEFSGLPEPDQVAKHDHPASPTLVPIARASDWVRFLNDNEGLVLVDNGIDEVPGGIAPWWTFTADPSAGDGYECPYGGNCFNVAFVDDVGFFIVGEEWVVTLWQLDHADGTLFAWFQGQDADDVAFGRGLVESTVVGD
ncbi:MAG: hypothetical protein HKN93_00460, partial [Acidimicrobiia bacterium]|nr:hypothetical protein [Acidimicrobiia bacterium]